MMFIITPCIYPYMSLQYIQIKVCRLKGLVTHRPIPIPTPTSLTISGNNEWSHIADLSTVILTDN